MARSLYDMEGADGGASVPVYMAHNALSKGSIFCLGGISRQCARESIPIIANEGVYIHEESRVIWKLRKNEKFQSTRCIICCLEQREGRCHLFGIWINPPNSSLVWVRISKESDQT